MLPLPCSYILSDEWLGFTQLERQNSLGAVS